MNTLVGEIYYNLPPINIFLSKNAIECIFKSDYDLKSSTSDTYVYDEGNLISSMKLDCPDVVSIEKPFTITFSDNNFAHGYDLSNAYGHYVNNTIFLIGFNNKPNDTKTYDITINNSESSTDNAIKIDEIPKILNSYHLLSNYTNYHDLRPETIWLTTPCSIFSDIDGNERTSVENLSFEVTLSNIFPVGAHLTAIISRQFWPSKWSSSYVDMNHYVITKQFIVN